jgi:hypothetical protein
MRIRSGNMGMGLKLPVCGNCATECKYCGKYIPSMSLLDECEKRKIITKYDFCNSKHKNEKYKEILKKHIKGFVETFNFSSKLNRSKKKLSFDPKASNTALNEFIDSLLVLRKRIQNIVLEDIPKTISMSVSKDKFTYETLIFSTWIVTLNLQSNTLRDLLHSRLCTELGLSQEEINCLYLDVDKRYRNYFTAYNMWIQNHQSGYILGDTIIEIMIKGNSDFSLPIDHIPLSSDIESLHAFSVFSSVLKNSISEIGRLKKIYDY